MTIICSAWNNGQHSASGAGYGLKVPIDERDRHFKKEWKSVTLELPSGDSYAEVSLNIDKPSFWSETCHELINKEIGKWLLSSGFAPWPIGRPPKIALDVVSEARFRVTRSSS